MTLSWNTADWPASVIAASMPITWAAAIATASGATGLTLPGMIEEPGCSAGSAISPRPASGPEFIQRRSLAIFVSATATPRSCADSSTAASCAASAANGFGCGTNASPVRGGELGGDARAEAGGRVEAGADRGRALREPQQARPHRLEPRAGVLDLRAPRRQLLRRASAASRPSGACDRS